MTVLTPSNAFPGASFLQHGSGLTATVQSYIYPGAVQPKSTTPTVLSYANAFPNAPFLQHGSGLTATVQAFWFPGAVQPVVSSPAPPSCMHSLPLMGAGCVLRLVLPAVIGKRLIENPAASRRDLGRWRFWLPS